MSGRPDDRAPVRGCDGCAAEPADAGVSNRPGLPELRYRIGTWGSFLARMLADLPKQEVDAPEGKFLPLAGLNTSAADDPTVAVADAWAVVADVLSFYQERIANEGYLRTATEQRSVLELARAIGYELSPGVAASAELAFSVDDTPPAPIGFGTAATPPAPPRTAAIPTGSAVQSVPGPGELPQTFETVEDLVARADWNELRPRITQPQSFAVASGRLDLRDVAGVDRVIANLLFVKGTSTGIKPGDRLLASDGSTRLPLEVLAVTTDDDAKQTMLRIDTGALPSVPPLPPPPYPPPATTGVIETRPLRLDPQTVSTKILPEVWDEQSLSELCAIQRWDPAELNRIVEGLLARPSGSSKLFVFRQRLAPFGHNAPPYAQVHLVPEEKDGNTVLVSVTGDAGDWDTFPRTIWEDSDGGAWIDSTDFDVFLERAVQKVTGGTWAFFESGAERLVDRITGVGEQTLNQFSLTARATGLVLQGGSPEKGNTKEKVKRTFRQKQTGGGGVGKTGTGATGSTGTAAQSALLVRKTSVYVESEELALAPLPVLDSLDDRSGSGSPLGAFAIELERMVLGLAVGQTLLLTGTTLDADDRAGSVRSEAVQLAAVMHRGGRSTLYLASRLRHRYQRATVTLTANAAAATHGATVSGEILGSGDGSARNQRFTLQKPPLTWVTAPTATGRKSTLSIRVNDVLWHEVPSLYGQAPDARCYVLRMGADGRTSVIFGDGVRGARLPTGTGNVVATYRSGIGQPGEVAAGSLSVLMSRPLGVRSVVNPLAAEGAADMEALADARRNAPVTVRTLGRIVSLRDYEDFVRSFAGIGKAQATAIWSGTSQLVHVTAAAADGTPIDPAGALYRNLTRAMAASSDGLERVQVDTFQPRFFRVEATVAVEPDADAARVLDAAAAALRERFTFANRDFGQRVTSAEVVSALQNVAGVVACTLSTLVKVDETGADQGSGAMAILPADVAHWDESSKSMVAADLLLLHPTGIRLTEAGNAS